MEPDDFTSRLRVYLRLGDTADATLLSALIAVAKYSIERYCKRHFAYDGQMPPAVRQSILILAAHHYFLIRQSDDWPPHVLALLENFKENEP